MTTFYLVFSRGDECRVVKRRPMARAGEWVVQLAVTYPPPPPLGMVDIELPPERVLERVDADVGDAFVSSPGGSDGAPEPVEP